MDLALLAAVAAVIVFLIAAWQGDLRIGLVGSALFAAAFALSIA